MNQPSVVHETNKEYYIESLAITKVHYRYLLAVLSGMGDDIVTCDIITWYDKLADGYKSEGIVGNEFKIMSSSMFCNMYSPEVNELVDEQPNGV